MKTLLSLVLLLCAATALPAQTLGTGWFVSIGGGLAGHDNGPFSRRLASYTPRSDGGEGAELLYRTEPFAQIAPTLWAGADVVLDGTWLVGLSGERVSFPTVESINGPDEPRDRYDLSGMGGGVDLGYVVFNRSGGVVFPYLHVGYYGYTLEYHNNQSEAIPFFEGDPVPAGASATYTGSAPRVAVGVGLQTLLGSGSAGVVVGARLAYGRMPSRPLWQHDGSDVNNGGHTPEYNAVLLTLTLGAGGGW